VSGGSLSEWEWAIAEEVRLESAIPPRLTARRTRHPRVPDDYEPGFPSFVARHSSKVRTLVMAYLGVQGASTPSWMDAALGDRDGPGHHDRATATHPEPGGPADEVTVAYWEDPAAFDRWFARYRGTWLDGAGFEGRWIEVVRPSVERYETIFGRRSRPEGAAAMANGFSGPVREHGYWGGMRDRMPASQRDGLHDPGDLDVERDGERIRVRPRGSLCLIRSGQDWSDSDGDERACYLQVIEPALRRGMEVLRDDGRSVGCLSNRYLTLLDDVGFRAERSYGMSWWRSLADLERWVESHPTHLDIFTSFGRLAAASSGRLELRLYHEVCVATPEEQWFEYASCHPRTGLLAAVPPV
jgi:aldoxime dehydratase